MAYREYLIRTEKATGGGSTAEVRARPLDGQGIPTNIMAACSTDMRNEYPVGTIFKLKAKLTDRQGGNQYLYSHYNSPYEVVSEDKANDYIAIHF